MRRGGLVVPFFSLCAVTWGPISAKAEAPPVNFSAGPQVAWSWGKVSAWEWGWEGGAGLGVYRVNLGQTRRKGGGLAYGVFEPYTPLYVGGTVGGGYDDALGGVLVLGLWESYPLVYPDRCLPEQRRRFGLLLTIAVGYRYAGSHQLYLTTKAGASQSVTACNVGAGASAGPGFQ
jgi:hypothetical protein